MASSRPVAPLSPSPLLLPTGVRAPSQLELVRECHRRGFPGLSLEQFVAAGWDGGGPEVVGGDALVWNWHLSVVCRHVEALVLDAPGTPQNLLVNVPPGTMKSLVCSVFLPAWVWLFRATWRAIFASGTPSIVSRDSLKCRALIRSEWYQETFRPSWEVSGSQDEKQHFANTEGGFRKGLGAGAAVTGERADLLLADDPNDAKEIHGKPHREAINERWWSSAFHNRVADPQKSKRCVIMQRLHREDLAGYVLEREKGDWAHLCIPMEGDPTGPGDKPTWLGWRDERKEGELMFPERFTAEYLAKERRALGSAGYAGQMAQRPTAEGGNQFQRAWWRFWRRAPGASPRPDGCSQVPAKVLAQLARADFRWDKCLISVDCTFKDPQDSANPEKLDYVVATVIGVIGAERFILGRERGRWGVSGTCDAILRLRKDWPQARKVAVELKANGDAVVQALKGKIPGVVGVNPEGGKEARAAAIAPDVEGGDVYLPEEAEWLGEWVDEFADFPRGKHDDQVDSLSQGLITLESEDAARVRALLGLR